MIKDSMIEAVTLLRIQENKLTDVSKHFSGREKQLFEKCVLAQREKDTGRAAIYAEEIAQLRKITKVLLRSQLSLRQAALRLETVKDFKDAGIVLGPIVNTVNRIREEVVHVVPEVANGLARVDELLDTVMIETGSARDLVFDESIRSEEARKVLQEASEMSAMRMKSRFPDLPEESGHLEEASESSTQ